MPRDEDILSVLSFFLLYCTHSEAHEMVTSLKFSATDGCTLMACNWYAYIISSGCHVKEIR